MFYCVAMLLYRSHHGRTKALPTEGSQSPGGGTLAGGRSNSLRLREWMYLLCVYELLVCVWCTYSMIIL